MKLRVVFLGALFVCLVFNVNAQVPLYLDVEDSLIQHFVDTNIPTKKTSQPFNRSKPGTLNLSKTDSLISYAFSYFGNRYRRGGTGAKGFDCSGFTMVVYKQFGIKLPHTSAGQGLVGVYVAKQNIQKGDLILFKGANRRSKRIGHVGIVISNKGEDVKFIHSSTSHGVRVDVMNAAYYKSRYVKTVRLPELYK